MPRSAQKALPSGTGEGQADPPSHVAGIVRRSVQFGGKEAWGTVEVGFAIPSGAAPGEIRRAQAAQQAVLRACWNTTTGIVPLPLEEALALGPAWPKQGLAALSSAAAAARQPTRAG